MTIVAPVNNDSKKSTSNSSAATPVPVQRPMGPPSKHKRQDYFDYILYLGPSKDLKYGDIDTSIYASEELWKELNRCSMIRFNHKLIEDSRKTGVLRPEAYN